VASPVILWSRINSVFKKVQVPLASFVLLNEAALFLEVLCNRVNKITINFCFKKQQEDDGEKVSQNKSFFKKQQDKRYKVCKKVTYPKSCLSFTTICGNNFSFVKSTLQWANLASKLNS